MPSADTTICRRASKCDGAATTVGEKLVHRCDAHRGHASGKLHESSAQHLAQTQTGRYVAPDDRGGFQTAALSHACYTIDVAVDPERDCKDKESLPQGGGTKGGREAAWPPSPLSFLNSYGTEPYSPHRQHDASQERRDRERAFLLDYRSLTFVERQELEQLAVEHRHEELVRVEEEARRKLASEGRWVNRTSRAILARSSSSYCGGGGGRSSSSVFERLARRASDHDGITNEEWTGEPKFGGNGDGGHGRQPFTPMINSRSSLLAPRMPHRDEDGCPQQRLYRDGEEQLRRRERRVQLADRALRERSVGCYVNPVSERVLARRNRSRVIRFQSKMMEELEVNQFHVVWLCGIETPDVRRHPPQARDLVIFFRLKSSDGLVFLAELRIFSRLST